MSRKAKEVSEISQVYLRARWGIGGCESSEFLSGRGGSADALVNVAAGEFKFVAVVLTKNLVFHKTYGKIGVAGSHFSAYGYTISLFVVAATEWKAIECKYYFG